MMWISEECRKHNVAVTSFSGKEATEENFYRNVEGKNLVHLACHGFSDNSHANYFGSLILTPVDKNEERNDGFLTVGELAQTNMNHVELAILSACETNQGVEKKQEGIMSLSHAMMTAGAKRTVSSNWSVDDYVTANMMFYLVKNVLEYREEGKLDYCQALQQARKTIRNHKQYPAWQHPYYWAPFVITGPGD